MTTLESIRSRRDEVLDIARRHGVLTVKVFGSVVRGDDTESSDVDLLITTGNEVSSWFPAGLILELEELLGRRVDVVTESAVNEYVRDQVFSEAVAL
jgi:predicted nucleotidyltransferase